MKKVFPLFTFVVIFSCFLGCNNPQNQSSANEKTSSVSPADTTEFASRVRAMEQKGEVYEQFFEKLDGITSAFSTYMGLLSVFLGLISFVMLGFQIWVTRRDNKVIDEMNKSHQKSIQLYDGSNQKLVQVIDEMRKNYQESMKSQEEGNNKLMDAVIRNTNKTTHFIASYENLIAIKTTSEGLNKEIQQIKDEKEAIAKVQKDKIIELNGKAMRLAEKVFKANYSSTFFSGSEDNAFKSFYIEVAPYISLTESNKNLEQDWNADVYFIIALYYLLNVEPVDAKRYFDKAYKRVTNFVNSSPKNTDALFPEEKVYKPYGGIDNWNKILKSKCAFYAGLRYYRLGEFDSAIPEFETAFKDFKNEIDPQFFYFQSQYWAEKKIDDFKGTMKKMTALSETIESDSQKDERAKKMALARLYKKIGDFYLPSKVDDRLPSKIDDRYAAEKSLQKALEYYKNAYDLIQDVNGELQNIPGGHLAPMVYFALGKTLKDAGESWKETPDDLLKKSIFTCNQVIGNVKNPETKYILYYTLAYCQHELNLDGDAKYNITFALVELDRFCSNSNYYGYSPVKNIMLRSDQLREELNTFRRELV
jgi:tetratricopeptide (TPR) repeat protein